MYYGDSGTAQDEPPTIAWYNPALGTFYMSYKTIPAAVLKQYPIVELIARIPTSK